jgi:hypothetical protein
MARGSKLPRNKAQASLRTPKTVLECGSLLPEVRQFDTVTAGLVVTSV